MRRPEDAAAIARNWPLGSEAPKRKRCSALLGHSQFDREAGERCKRFAAAGDVMCTAHRKAERNNAQYWQALTTRANERASVEGRSFQSVWNEVLHDEINRLRRAQTGDS